MRTLTAITGIAMALMVVLVGFSFKEPADQALGMVLLTGVYASSAVIVAALAERPRRASLLFAAPFALWGLFWWTAAGFSASNYSGLLAAGAVVVAYLAATLVLALKKGRAQVAREDRA